MTLALYFDHHVHAAITVGIRELGIDVMTAAQDGAAQMEDEAILW